MLNGKRYTTINTDAGVHYDLEIAAYAYWIRSESITIKHSEKFKEFSRDTVLAELNAILNALYVISKDEYLSSADYIVVNCDNTTALEFLEKNQFTKRYEKSEKFYNQILSTIKSPITFKHVKGHSRNKNSRSFVNNWCDREIRKHYK